jgi:hypothetical protein
MKQHFLAQTYQGGFVDLKTPEGFAPYVWIFTRATGRWKRKAPENFAWQTDLYTVRDLTGQRDDSVDDLMGKCETRFSRAMRHDFAKGPLDAQSRADLAYFVSLFSVRVPLFFQEYVPALLSSETTMKKLANQIPRFAGALAKTFRSPEPENVATLFQSLTSDEQKAFVLSIVLAGVDDTAERLFKMSWAYMFTTPDLPFITSETPVVFTVNRRGELPLATSYLDDPDVEITFPLTSTMTLVMFRGSAPQVAGRITEAGVAELNRRVIWHARDYVLSSKQAFPGDRDLALWAARQPVPLLERIEKIISKPTSA